MAARDTKNRILDAAEELFAKKAHGNVTFRQISELCGLHISQIVYHFRNKDTLLGAVVARRANSLNEERLAHLETYQRLFGGRKLDVEALVRAFIDPYLSKLAEGDEGWRNYGAVIGRIVWDPIALPMMERAYNDVARLYLKALGDALPNASEEAIHRGFHFMLALVFSAGADSRRLDRLSDDRYSSKDYDRTYAMLVPFVTAGFLSIAGTEESTQASDGVRAGTSRG